MEALSSQPPTVNLRKKIITLEEYRGRPKSPTLEDITPYLLAYNHKNRKYDGKVSDGEVSEGE